MTAALRFGVGFGLVLAGCSGEADPRPEWVITVSTDAPVPQLGDRLLIETVTESGELACDSCRRVLSAASPEDLPVSFSIVPNGSPLLLRARLYRAGITGSDGLPETDQLIEQVGILPATTTRTALALRLSTNCFGVAADWARGRSCTAEHGSLEPFAELTNAEPLQPGSSPLAESRDCGAEAPAGMKCIAGGLFVRGDQTALSLNQSTNSRPERLAQLSPFFLDEDEVSVAQVRDLVRRRVIDDEPRTQGVRGELAYGCTYLGSSDETHDDYPVNCLLLAQAQEVCTALGKRLPTEAEWEYAAGNRDAETTYPWGPESSICEHAIVARAQLVLGAMIVTDGSCLASTEALTSPVPGGHPLDITRQGIKNMAGNVAELVADAFAAYTSDCWGRDPVLVDPLCKTTDTPDFPVAVRGGEWSGNMIAAPAAARNSIREGGSGSPSTGFRCAKDAE